MWTGLKSCLISQVTSECIRLSPNSQPDMNILPDAWIQNGSDVILFFLWIYRQNLLSQGFAVWSSIFPILWSKGPVILPLNAEIKIILFREFSWGKTSCKHNNGFSTVGAETWWSWGEGRTRNFCTASLPHGSTTTFYCCSSCKWREQVPVGNIEHPPFRSVQFGAARINMSTLSCRRWYKIETVLVPWVSVANHDF